MLHDCTGAIMMAGTDCGKQSVEPGRVNMGKKTVQEKLALFRLRDGAD